jgi:hypothetical protein
MASCNLLFSEHRSHVRNLIDLNRQNPVSEAECLETNYSFKGTENPFRI